MSNQTPRILQQQPERDGDREQQQQGSTDLQDDKPGARGEPMGEGSYKGTADYNQRQAEYMKTHDVRKDAEAARPRSEEEARDMERAEEEGKSHSRGEH
ncbi:MAG TPA: hypothetical protein VIE63_07475 [Ramlibacter sp.]